MKKKHKDHLDHLHSLTKDKNKDQIRNYLEELPSNVKGGVFEDYLELLFMHNGWVVKNTGSKGDAGADLLIYHHGNANPDFIIQAKNMKNSLDENGVSSEINKFETKGSTKYNCKHYQLYSIQGFTKDLSLDSMVAIGKKRRIPVMADLGSGALEDLSKLGLPNEYAVKEIVKLNPQLITFSGDKLLGGPQAGVMLGSENIIKKCNKNPIYRSVRCDKFTVSLLEETLKLMCQKSQMKYNLALNLLATPRKHLLKRIKNVMHSVSKKKKSYKYF